MAISPKVVVVGSLHYDIFVEAPHRPAAGETVPGYRWFPKFGGKGGNQAAAIVRAGSPCRMVSAVGADSFGTYLLERLTELGVDATNVAVVNAGSGMSVAIADTSGDYGAVIVSGSNLLIDPSAMNDIPLWEGVGQLVLQNEVTEAINITAARAARSRGAAVVLNAAPARAMSEELSSLVDVLVVNAGEAEALSGISVDDLTAAEAAACELARHFPVVLVTAGGDGVAAATGETSFSEPALKVDLVSTHGAGDCFIGTFVARRAEGADLHDAVSAANLAAARHVSGKM
ncbi:MAG: PfkB family carbohydrate kinase [Tropicimonas sp.]|uniref:PfkB family carbohydrate kinase n=1 Tax=Tropicimonas sp. TaxID=2067044 RepID=UPI003A8C5E10